MKNNIVVIIPAYNPDEKIYEILKDLKTNEYTKIIVINDGSKSTEIFEKIEEDVTIITHEKNEGKGQALKTGFQYVLDNFNDIIGVITVDADGQHLIQDINKIYKKIVKDTDSVILGSRNLKDKNVPFRSKIGNLTFSKILEKRTKIKITDTQTGLRAIPIQYLKDFINIKGKRFEYETNMILTCLKNNIKIIEENIESVYIDNNKSSNYKIIKDSIKICNSIILIKGK